MAQPEITDSAVALLACGQAPAWASEWGEDCHGVFLAFTLRGITQRLRWMPAGVFHMGSPENEPGRSGDEGPAHWVRISRGFWLFDTPCTLALWERVIGRNPSHFLSPDRPVVQVSWDDIQGFLEKINVEVPGLALTLPSEAQWEYACRAGTETALYSGPIEILGANNAPALDPIAWYGGNSGVMFELDDGSYSLGRIEKQYTDAKAGTRLVGTKAPNPWGLYDMLGNVWEWCADGQRVYDDHWKQDPVGPLDDGADRVIRGGSWYGVARDCRSAYRRRYQPGFRGNFLGFRCARRQDP